MKLLIENQLTHVKYEFTGLTDTFESRMFYSFEIGLPANIDDGVYEYTLIDNDDVKATGLLQVGDFVPEKKEYNQQNSGYIQYNG